MHFHGAPLQGWKLFAEAHNLQAGEEVCFEAFGPSRLVVKRVQSRAVPEPPPISLSRKLPDSPLLGNACSKSLKSGDFSSPSRHSSWMSYQVDSPKQARAEKCSISTQMDWRSAILGSGIVQEQHLVMMSLPLKAPHSPPSA